MRIPWRREQPPEEQPPEQQASSSRWRTIKDALMTTAQAQAASTNDNLQDHTASIKDRLRTKAYQLASSPTLYLVLSGFVLGSASTLGATFVYKRCFRRLRTVEWVTPDVLARRKWVKGVVTSFGWRWPLRFRRVPALGKELKDQTIHVRIAGVDAPEGSHFGRPAQPYAEEALAWLKNMVEGKAVYCQLIRRDQYSRIVSVVTLTPPLLPGWFTTGRSLALEMLRAGVSTTYEQAGAEYGKCGKDEFLRVEAEARAARRGMWKHGTTGETPAQYKRRYAQGRTDVEAQVRGKAKVEEEKRALLIYLIAIFQFPETSDVYQVMKLASALLLSFVASAQAAVTSTNVLPSGVPLSSGLPFSTLSFDTTAASSIFSSILSSESSVIGSITTSFTAVPTTSSGSASLASSGTTTSASAAASTGAAGRTDAVQGVGLVAGAAAGLLAFLL
ncbi:hypothetical protein AZE42_07936 [Rhizopogon vesiculosus]|uniref:TNase-like domain-containing protein n=1 Tax=Rhizopogon vesiculosus TaxID=180088 RepID=A0A1J8QX66_9AGAM|nr:hypothetical protein AZE42_07936 [Rhizopogon vesiculosus]